MKELCIPFTYVADNTLAEVEVKIPSTGEIWRYRIQPVVCEHDDKYSAKKTETVDILQHFIEEYDHNWELIQILGLNTKTGNIHILYREKTGQYI